ncbi:hypothetical protein LOTGIDRAFT_175849 [Lottia gigantea]|uniref:Sushi domain-containing protein n=1 Tax=Lottia gigantea TaxID=225164 RepID=V4BLK0_LOTGI|nr:hypothetical protein LOTGIDRAFT_175849 [Lottia gigantea]ESO89569.1 hypothetical protein LOTGIDRAFT_175849 [Lottia gigantea]
MYTQIVKQANGVIRYAYGGVEFEDTCPACGPPPVPKGHQLLEVIESPGNYTARYKCGQYYVHRQIGETRCIGDSDWTETPCKDTSRLRNLGGKSSFLQNELSFALFRFYT